MKLDNIGEVIAYRNIILHGNEDKIIKVLLGTPKVYKQDISFYCPFQIKGIGDEEIMCIYGIDAVQALILALKAIAVELDLLNRKLDGKLKWEGDESGDLGFSCFTK